MFDAMQRLIPIALIIAWSSSLASAGNVAKVSPKELAQAINIAAASAVPYRKAKISASDIRMFRCIGPDEEPTELKCSWRQRTDHGWAARKTWLATDGRGWHVID